MHFDLHRDLLNLSKKSDKLLENLFNDGAKLLEEFKQKTLDMFSDFKQDFHLSGKTSFDQLLDLKRTNKQDKDNIHGLVIDFNRAKKTKHKFVSPEILKVVNLKSKNQNGRSSLRQNEAGNLLVLADEESRSDHLKNKNTESGFFESSSCASSPIKVIDFNEKTIVNKNYIVQIKDMEKNNDTSSNHDVQSVMLNDENKQNLEVQINDRKSNLFILNRKYPTTSNLGKSKTIKNKLLNEIKTKVTVDVKSKVIDDCTEKNGASEVLKESIVSQNVLNSTYLLDKSFEVNSVLSPRTSLKTPDLDTISSKHLKQKKLVRKFTKRKRSERYSEDDIQTRAVKRNLSDRHFQDLTNALRLKRDKHTLARFSPDLCKHKTNKQKYHFKAYTQAPVDYLKEKPTEFKRIVPVDKTLNRDIFKCKKSRSSGKENITVGGISKKRRYSNSLCKKFPTKLRNSKKNVFGCTRHNTNIQTTKLREKSQSQLSGIVLSNHRKETNQVKLVGVNKNPNYKRTKPTVKCSIKTKTEANRTPFIDRVKCISKIKRAKNVEILPSKSTKVTDKSVKRISKMNFEKQENLYFLRSKEKLTTKPVDSQNSSSLIFATNLNQTNKESLNNHSKKMPTTSKKRKHKSTEETYTVDDNRSEGRKCKKKKNGDLATNRISGGDISVLKLVDANNQSPKNTNFESVQDDAKKQISSKTNEKLNNDSKNAKNLSPSSNSPCKPKKSVQWIASESDVSCKSEIASWAKGICFKEAILKQHHNLELDPEELFAYSPHAIDLEKMFDTVDPKHHLRTSSTKWT